MEFTKLEKLLIGFFLSHNSVFSRKLLNFLLDSRDKYKKNFSAEENPKSENNLDQPSGYNNLNNLNNPTDNKKPTSNYKKVIWTFIIVILVLGFFVLLILSGFSFTPTQVLYDEVLVTNGSSYTLRRNGVNQRTIPQSATPNFYLTSSSTVEVTFNNGPFNSFFYTVRIVPASDFTNGMSNGSSSGSIATGAPTRGQLALAGNVLIDSVTGNAFSIDRNGAAVTNGNSGNNTLLTSALRQQFRGFLNNVGTTKPAPYNFGVITGFITNLIPLFFIIGILMFSWKRMGAMGGIAGGDSVFSIGKSQAKLAQSTLLFSDIAGIEEEKNELIEIVDYLKSPERYASMGARVPKGVILYGPPGTGKTLLAKAVAGEAKVPFFQVSGSAFEDMLVGVGAKRVRDLFSKAVKSAPAIIFIDEIDSVGSKRGKFETTAGSLADQTLNQLLAEMDGFNTRTGVVVIAATNRLDVLDDALLRPGRFDRHIQVNLPDIKERVAILKIHSRNKNLSSSIDLEDIARRTPGFSGAQLENTLNEATLLAVRKRRKTITLEDLDEAIDRVIAGPAKKTRVISLEEKKQIAYHEAGHALVGLHTKGSEVVEKITIIPRGKAAGYTLSVPEIQELSIQKKSDLLGMVAGLLGGRAAEEIVFGAQAISTGCANDFYKATNIVRAMVAQFGMTDIGMAQYYPSEGVMNPYQQKNFSEFTSQLIDKEIEKIFKERYQYASNIIKSNKKELDLIVETLMILETIVKPQIDYIHKNLKLPPEALEKKKELEEKAKAKEKEAKETKNSKEVKTEENKEKESEKKTELDNSKS